MENYNSPRIRDKDIEDINNCFTTSIYCGAFFIISAAATLGASFKITATAISIHTGSAYLSLTNKYNLANVGEKVHGLSSLATAEITATAAIKKTADLCVFMYNKVIQQNTITEEQTLAFAVGATITLTATAIYKFRN